MTSFVNRFYDSLQASPDIAILYEARDAFASPTEEDKNKCIHLQSDDAFLEKLLAKVEATRADLKVSTAILEIIYLALYSHIPATSIFVTRWMQSMQKTKFFTEMSYASNEEQAYDSVTALSIVITLEIIESAKDARLNREILDSDLYLSSPDTLIEIHNLIFQMSATRDLCSTISMAWGVFLHRLLSTVTEGEICDPAYQGFIDHAFAGDVAEPHRYLIELAMGSGLYASLTSILDALPHAHENEYLTVLFSFFTQTQEYVQLSEASTVLYTRMIKSRALANTAWADPAVRRMLEVARQQFPHDHKPFLQMVKALAHSGSKTIAYLEHLPTFTQTLPTGFQSFSILSEDGGQTVIELSQPLELYRSRHGNSELTIMPGSRGLMVTEPRTRPVVLWQHPYSALKYLARVLRFSADNLTVDQHVEIVTDVLSLLARLVSSCDDVEEFLYNLLEETSEDIQQTVYEVFEQTLQSRGDSNILIECSNFFQVLLRHAPATSWTFLARLSLFGRSARGNHLLDITLSTKASEKNYELLVAITKMVRAAVADLPISALKTGDRFSRAKGDFILAATQDLFVIYRSYVHWPALQGESGRFLLGIELSQLFYEIISLHSGNHLQDAPRTMQVRVIIDPAAQHLLSQHTDVSDLSDAKLANLASAMQCCLYQKSGNGATGLLYMRTVFLFYRSVLLSGNSDQFSGLRRVCFDQVPRLVKLLDHGPDCREEITGLLVDTLESPGPVLPSILAIFGSEKRQLKTILMDCLDTLKVADESKICAFWRLLNNLLSPSQEGIALYLLEKEAQKDSPLVKRMVKYVTSIDEDSWSPRKSSFVLRTMCAAQNWPAIIQAQLKSNTAFWTKIDELSSTCHIDVGNQSDEVVTVANAFKLVCAGYLARITASHLNFTSLTHREPIEERVKRQIDTINLSVLAVGYYRSSLHGNLSRNVSQKYPDFSLRALVRTSWSDHNYGESYYYDLSLAQKLIPANSFLRELRIANFNLSLMDAQNARISGFHVLIASLVIPTISNVSIWDTIISVLSKMVSQREDMTIPIAPEIDLGRTSTVSLVIRSLCQTAIKFGRESQCTDLLPGLIQLLSEFISEIQHAQSLMKTRLVLQSLCDVLDVLTKISIPKAKVLPLQRSLSAIFDLAICKFAPIQARNAMSKGHTEARRDLNVIIVLGRHIAVLIDKHDLSPTPFAADLIQSNAVDAAIDLFSKSSDDLASELDGNSNSALQLLSMCLDVSKAADQLMHAGIFRMLLDSKIGLRIQNDVSWLQNSFSAHALWTRSLLPLVLSLIHELGMRIQDEVKIFVTSYARQIEANFSHWIKPNYITLDQTEELLLLLLLVEAVDKMSAQSLSNLPETRVSLSDGLDYLLTHPRTTRALILPPEDQEAVLQNMRDLQQTLQAL